MNRHIETTILDLKNVLFFMLPIKLRILKVQILNRGRFSIMDLWDRSVARKGSKIALIFESRQYTYRQMDERVRRAATHLKQADLPAGAHIAIFGNNDPSFWWYALAAIGLGYIPILLRPGTAAGLKPYLEQFEHIDCLLLSDRDSEDIRHVPKHRFRTIINFHQSDDFNDGFQPLPQRAMREARVGVSLVSLAMYLGTSGTTGQSKACLSFHGALLGYIRAHQLLKRLREDDRSYNCASLSHGQGFFSGSFIQWATGGSVVLGREFNPESYLDTCCRHGVTVIGYCGTLPRKLLSALPKAKHQSHSIRVAAGHELLPLCRAEFQRRLNIPELAEYFASTEGSFFFGIVNHPAAIGFAGPLSRLVHPFAIVRLDDDNEPIFANGRPQRCEIGEPGELFTHLVSKDPLTLSGYANDALEKETKCASLFRRGDRWFRTGDIISIDRWGYMFFHGKRKTSFRIDGNYVNPPVVEDKLSTEAAQEIGIRDALCFFQKDSDGRKSVALRLSGHVNADALQSFLKAHLEPWEMPLDVSIEEGSFPETISFRKLRPGSVVARETRGRVDRCPDHRPYNTAPLAH
jgi:fatty-acyl-CoA synthase